LWEQTLRGIAGANNLTAMTRTLEHIFGDRTTFSVFSAPAKKTITYHRFSDMADDVVDVRIYQGIHFRSADEVARRQGTAAPTGPSATSCGIRIRVAPMTVATGHNIRQNLAYDETT
jgi:hypothetical protein